jgi:hypothetical protein
VGGNNKMEHKEINIGELHAIMWLKMGIGVAVL